MSAPSRPALRALAARAGIVTAYRDLRGRLRPTTDATRIALLGAMGWEAATERAAGESLARWAEGERTRLLAPVAVLPAARAGGRGARLAVRLARAARSAPAYRLAVTTEDGVTLVQEGRLRGLRGRARIALPALSLGYHTARLTLGDQEATQQLIVAPSRCPDVRALLGSQRAFGLAVQLYSVRSAQDWGAGDLGSLTTLADAAADDGAGFLSLNPLHLLRNRGADVSPYRPLSRLYRNPLYVDPAAVPEFSECAAARDLIASAAARERLARLRAAAAVDYGGVMGLKTPVLEALYRCFAAGREGGQRRRAYRQWTAAQGPALDHVATFLTLEAHLGADWRRWPVELRRPDATGIAAFRRDHAAEHDFHRWVQFELDRQLAAVAARAPRPLGLIGDLAVGSAPDGADAWAFPSLFASAAHLGAPPDDYAEQGQDWALAPLDPHRLAADGYRFWALLLRQAFAHMGGLRLDHVLGLVRQFWIPAGAGPAEGAYVRYPTTALLAVLALEATRRSAIVIGEDLGTVPRGLVGLMERWRILSTRLLYFERDRRGAFRPAARYPRRAVVSVGSHDLPPLAGWWAERDLALRRATGMIRSEAALARARAQRARDRRALRRRLLEAGLSATEPPAPADLCAAAHSFLAGTPAALLALSVDDLVGETEPVNLPGVGPERFPSWTRRLSRPIAALAGAPAVARARGDLSARAWLRS